MLAAPILPEPQGPYFTRFCTVVALGKAACKVCKPAGVGVRALGVPMERPSWRTHSRSTQVMKNSLLRMIGPSNWPPRLVSRYLGGLVRPVALCRLVKA